MARHRSPRGRQGQTGVLGLDASIPLPRVAEPTEDGGHDTAADGTLPRLSDADAADGAPERAVGGRRRSSSRRLPAGAVTVVLVAGAVAGLIVGATALLGARQSEQANPDKGTDTPLALPAPTPAPQLAPPPAPAPEATVPPAPAAPPRAPDAKPPADAAPKTTGAKPAVPAQGSEKRLKIWLTGYSFQDNTPPGSSTVSLPVVHKKAGGTGTYEDPITVAVPGSGSSAAWKGGTRFYLPTVQRYVIVEDTGASEAPAGQDGHLDMWVDGEGGSKSASDSCMDKITGTGIPAIMNPAPGKPVTPGPITHNGACNLPGGGGSSKSHD